MCQQILMCQSRMARVYKETVEDFNLDDPLGIDARRDENEEDIFKESAKLIPHSPAGFDL